MARFVKASLVAMAFLVGSCSYDHEIRFSLNNGRLVLVFDDGEPVALRQLFILELSKGTPTVWQLEGLDYNGRDIGRLAYGTVPPGTKQVVNAKPLRVGQSYEAVLMTIDGGGSREFVICPDVENRQKGRVIVVSERRLFTPRSDIRNHPRCT